MGWYQIVTSPLMWLLAALIALNSLIMVGLMYRVSRKAARDIGLSNEFIMKTLRTGAVASIGPAMGPFVGLAALVIAVGGAISWAREAAGIGSIGYELISLQNATTAAGVTMTREGMNLVGAANVLWVAALTCSPWVLTGGVGARLLPKLRDSALGRQPGLMAVVSSAAMLGMFAKFVVDYVIKPAQVAGTKPGLSGWASPAALFSGVIAGFIWITLSEKFNKPSMKQFIIIIGIFFGMGGGQIVAMMK
jgi:hypothetical protein